MNTTFSSIAVLIAATATCAALTTLPASSNEVMKDKCSDDVAIVPAYGDGPNTPGTVVLSRGPDGRAAWTAPFTVKLGDSGHIRWWCHSTRGNSLDPGTWRPGKDFGKFVVCLVEGMGKIRSKESTEDGEENSGGGLEEIGKCADGDLKIFETSARDGWTPERSRCNDRSTKIRASIGRGRAVKIECLGRS